MFPGGSSWCVHLVFRISLWMERDVGPVCCVRVLVVCCGQCCVGGVCCSGSVCWRIVARRE